MLIKTFLRFRSVIEQKPYLINNEIHFFLKIKLVTVIQRKSSLNLRANRSFKLLFGLIVHRRHCLRRQEKQDEHGCSDGETLWVQARCKCAAWIMTKWSDNTAKKEVNKKKKKTKTEKGNPTKLKSAFNFYLLLKNDVTMGFLRHSLPFRTKSKTCECER